MNIVVGRDVKVPVEEHVIGLVSAITGKPINELRPYSEYISAGNTLNLMMLLSSFGYFCNAFGTTTEGIPANSTVVCWSPDPSNPPLARLVIVQTGVDSHRIIDVVQEDIPNNSFSYDSSSEQVVPLLSFIPLFKLYDMRGKYGFFLH